MRKKISILLFCIMTAVAMLTAFTGCSEEFFNEVGAIASEVLETENEPTTEATVAETTATETAVAESTKANVSDDTDISVTESEQKATSEETVDVSESAENQETLLDKNGVYTTKDDVALFIYQYGSLPDNFITKKEARALGWEGGSLEDYAPGKCIGGDYFGNYEGLLPEVSGRNYYECDIDTLGASSRGAKRIIFSNDGLIYYTADHYESFTLLYGEE